MDRKNKKKGRERECLFQTKTWPKLQFSQLAAGDARPTKRGFPSLCLFLIFLTNPVKKNSLAGKHLARKCIPVSPLFMKIFSVSLWSTRDLRCFFSLSGREGRLKRQGEKKVSISKGANASTEREYISIIRLQRSDYSREKESRDGHRIKVKALIEPEGNVL